MNLDIVRSESGLLHMWKHCESDMIQISASVPVVCDFSCLWESDVVENADLCCRFPGFNKDSFSFCLLHLRMGIVSFCSALLGSYRMSDGHTPAVSHILTI